MVQKKVKIDIKNHKNMLQKQLGIILHHYMFFWGHFWPTFGGGGHKNILMDQVLGRHILSPTSGVKLA